MFDDSLLSPGVVEKAPEAQGLDSATIGAACGARKGTAAEGAERQACRCARGGGLSGRLAVPLVRMRPGSSGDGTPECGRRELGRLSGSRMFTARRVGPCDSNQVAVPTRMHTTILLERSKLLPLFLPVAEAAVPSLRCEHRTRGATTEVARRRRLRYFAQFVPDRRNLSMYQP